MKSARFFSILIVLVLCRSTGDARGSYGLTKDKNEYNVNKIPASLLKDAEAVVRINSVRFEVKNRKRSKEMVKRAVTIFKKEKRDYGELFVTYDKFSEIDNFEGKIYDASGEEIRELEDKDIRDFSIFSGYTFFSDNRAKHAELYHNQYPYTVEFTYELSNKGNLNWPSWSSQISLDPIEQNRFEVIVSDEDSLRYWCSNDTVKPVITVDGSKKAYVWESTNLPKLSKDAAGDDIEDVATAVHIAPTLFEIGNYRGDMRTWKDFGTWDYNLIKGRDKLPESAIRDVHALLQPTDDNQAKIKKLYRYMQDRTRYVSVQLGIGGWQPFDATFVQEHGYGDCKALSNYMVSLLKEAGIIGYSVLIQPGDHRFPFINEFPSNQFTHVIVCVPQERDTVWLECTSQSIPYKHIGDFTEHREALLITPDGGIVVRTPGSSPAQNLQRRTASVHLSYSGSADVHSIVSSTGNQQDNVRQALHDASPEERERWILNNLGIQNANLKNYKLEGVEEHNIEVALTVQVSLPRFASSSGDRIFFVPNLMQRQTYVPPDVAQRLSPIRYDYPYLDIDSIYYFLPKDYTVESIPKETTVESSFGKYRSQTIAYGDTAIMYIRTKEIHEYSIPAKNYPEYRKFHTDIVKADKAQIVLVKKNPW
jgi:hypothetical protein